MTATLQATGTNQTIDTQTSQVFRKVVDRACGPASPVRNVAEHNTGQSVAVGAGLVNICGACERVNWQCDQAIAKGSPRVRAA